MGLIYFLGYLAILSSLVPLIFLFKKKKTSLLLKILVLEILLVNFSNLIIFLFSKFDQINIFSIHVFFESTLLLFLFKEQLVLTELLRKFFSILVLIHIIFFTYVLTISPDERFTLFGAYSKILLSLIAVILIVLRYRIYEDDSLSNDFFFNISAAVLIYNGMQLYVVIFNSLFRFQLESLLIFTWPIIQLSTFIYHILISRAIWKLKN